MSVPKARNTVFVHHGNIPTACLAHSRHLNICWMTKRKTHTLWLSILDPSKFNKTNLILWSAFLFLQTQTMSSYCWMCTSHCICLPRTCKNNILLIYNVLCFALSKRGGIQKSNLFYSTSTFHFVWNNHKQAPLKAIFPQGNLANNDSIATGKLCIVLWALPSFLQAAILC